MAKQTGGNGYNAEEAMRGYFLTLGYFVVRGLPFSYAGCDVTDVDLWLYMRSTSFTRERICVDIKNRRTPQAMERVFWTKGLKEVLGLDRAIVVTTDNRQAMRSFGAANQVTVLHGDFVQRAVKGYTPLDRIAEEELFALLAVPCVIDSSVHWKSMYCDMKERLLDSLSFNGCNIYLSAVKLLLEEFLTTDKRSIPALRLLYVAASYFLIALDFSTRNVAHLEAQERKACIAEGLRFGDSGRQRTENVVEMAIRLLEDSGKVDLFSRSGLKTEFERQMTEFPSEILAEHFSRSDSMKRIFELSRDFERQAFAKVLNVPDSCLTEQKAILGLFCDFFKIDRRKIL